MSVKMQFLVLGIFLVCFVYEAKGNAIQPFTVLPNQHKTLKCAEGEAIVPLAVHCFYKLCDPALKCVEKSENLCSQYKPCYKGVCNPQDDGDFKCVCKSWFFGRYCEHVII
ncbi:hypothetical protein SNE40_000887 [Patella caerulea]|uniref:EGF-like domain-containing protein n=1 Tax=Patella caerulea TaxID=87958 RepID=A0AAN8KBE3_PATCE